MDRSIESMNGLFQPDKHVPARLGSATIETGSLVLACESAGAVDDVIVAYANGIPIGRSAEIASLAEGDIVTVGCSYFPCVPLPCVLRIGSERGNRDFAAPFTVQSAREIERLVGPGRLESVKIGIAEGVLRGTAINPVNGHGRPMLLARVNGHTLRNVQFEGLRPREEGGAYIAFNMPIDVSDFTLAGIMFEIVQVPDLTILASLAFPRVDASAVPGLINRLDASIANVSKRLDIELVRLNESADRRHKEVKDTIDHTVQYLVALVFDKFAGMNANSGDTSTDDALTVVRKAIATSRRSSALRNNAVLRAGSPFFADGWHQVERDDKGFELRWMGPYASVLNPHPERPVTAVTITIGSTYQGMEPDITAMFDADPAECEVVASANGTPFTVKLVHRGPRTARPVDVVRLKVKSIASINTREELMRDRRVLSIAVLGMTFYYEDD